PFLPAWRSVVHTIVDIENLSPSQRAILAATAANRGRVQVAMRIDAHGWAAVAGRQVFADSQSREVAEEHVRAVNELQDMQLLRASARRGQYELTNIGWEMSRKLRGT